MRGGCVRHPRTRAHRHPPPPPPEPGRIDTLVNSAALDPKFDSKQAGHHTQDFETFPLEAWNQALQVNLTGSFLASPAVGGAMRHQGSGSIVHICSTYGLVR